MTNQIMDNISVTATMAIPSCPIDFRVSKFFRQSAKDQTEDQGVKISHVDHGLTSDLGEMSLGISRPLVVDLCLVQDTMSQSDVLEGLSPGFEVDPWALAYLLSLQGRGGNGGRLAVNEHDNIAFCRGIARNSWVIRFKWVRCGWVITRHHSSENIKFFCGSNLILSVR